MSLIHTAELAAENPFEYLAALLDHAAECHGATGKHSTASRYGRRRGRSFVESGRGSGGPLERPRLRGFVRPPREENAAYAGLPEAHAVPGTHQGVAGALPTMV
jgi:hypothetical protein